MKKQFKNWRTTLFGIGSAVIYLGTKIYNHEPIGPEDLSLALGMIGIGASAKDKQVTGGTLNQINGEKGPQP